MVVSSIFRSKTSTLTELVWTKCKGCVCCPVVHTHCWEPSLVFLPSLTNRLLGEAAGKPGGLGGRERNSSWDSFILLIPVWSSGVFPVQVKTVADFSTSEKSQQPASLHSWDGPSRTGGRKPPSCCFILRTTETGAADVSSAHPAVGAAVIGLFSQTRTARVTAQNVSIALTDQMGWI